jgi:hypothetical protein
VILAVSPTIQSKEDVKRAWERININYSLINVGKENPYRVNDNDSRFSAKTIQEFFVKTI